MYCEISNFCIFDVVGSKDVTLRPQYSVHQTKGTIGADVYLPCRLPLGIDQNGDGTRPCAEHRLTHRSGGTTGESHGLAC